MAQPHAYYCPRTLNEAVVLAAQPDALAIAGGALILGQSSLPFTTLVDLQHVAELKTVVTTEAGLRIGAACLLGSLLERDDIPAALKTALTRSMSPHVLNNTSVGEAILRRKDPALIEWFTVLVATSAAAETIIPQRSAAHREWRMLITADARIDRELITALVLPIDATARVGLAQVARTPADQAIVSAAACVRFGEGGRVSSAMAALGGVSEAPVDGFALGSLSGWPLNHETAQAAAEEVAARLNAPDDALGSSEYRRAMAAVCLMRALEQCVAAERIG